MVFPLINKRKFVVSLAIAFIAVIGDKNIEIANDPLVSALCDNVAHALIGAFTWLGTTQKQYNSILLLFEFIACAVLSSLIDVDHFVSARSFHLKDATGLKNRPFLHCTTLAALIVFSVISLSYWLKMNWIYELGWILAAAFFSHHVRDSKRRGFWLWPFGSTIPTPYIVYILAQMFLPHILTVIISSFPLPETKKTDFLPVVEAV